MAAIGDRSRKHGQSKTDIYGIWIQIIGRCTNQKDQAYDSYGGRGIYICDQWRKSFESFRDDLGPRPSMKHTVDRIDNNGPYSPENCRWASSYEQAKNTRRFCGKCRVDLQQKPLSQMTVEELASESTRLAHEEYSVRQRRAAVDAEHHRRSEAAA